MPWVKFLTVPISILGYSQTVKRPLVIFRSKHSNYLVQTQVIFTELHSFSHFKPVSILRIVLGWEPAVKVGSGDGREWKASLFYVFPFPSLSDFFVLWVVIFLCFPGVFFLGLP